MRMNKVFQGLTDALAFFSILSIFLLAYDIIHIPIEQRFLLPAYTVVSYMCKRFYDLLEMRKQIEQEVEDLREAGQ